MNVTNPNPNHISSGKGKARLTANEKKPSLTSDAEIMKKCLEENNGDNTKCKSQIEAFRFAYSAPPTPRTLPIRFLKRGSLTDV